MKRLAFALLSAVTLASCQDAGTPVSPSDLPDPSEAAIVDARAEGGNPGFAFQPPLAPAFDIEGFDPDVETRVVVCRLLLSDNDTCDPAAPPVWESETPVPVVDDRYRTIWRLSDSTEGLEALSRNLPPSIVPFYRIKVLAGTFELGHVDVRFAENASVAGDFPDEIIIVGTNRSLPIQYVLNQEALLGRLIQECLTGTGVIDCDAAVLDGADTVRVFTDEGFPAALAEFNEPILDEAGRPLVFLLEHIDALTETPVLPGVGNFARATVLDADGNVLGDRAIEVDRFILCLSEEVSFSPTLEIRRFDDGAPTILPSSPLTPECEVPHEHDHAAHAPAPSPSWGERAQAGLVRLASLFLPEPLAALHGGLNTTRMRCCSEFDAVEVTEQAPFLYGSLWEYSHPVAGSGVAEGPFFTDGDLEVCPYPYFGPNGLPGTGGADVWPVGNGGNSDLTLVRAFQVPSSAEEITVWVGIDNDVKVVLNGTDITASSSGDVGGGIDAEGFLRHDGCMTRDHIRFDPASELVNFGNVNVLEVVARDRGVVGYFDARVSVQGATGLDEE